MDIKKKILPDKYRGWEIFFQRSRFGALVPALRPRPELNQYWTHVLTNGKEMIKLLSNKLVKQSNLFFQPLFQTNANRVE